MYGVRTVCMYSTVCAVCTVCRVQPIASMVLSAAHRDLQPHHTRRACGLIGTRAHDLASPAKAGCKPSPAPGIESFIPCCEYIPAPPPLRLNDRSESPVPEAVVEHMENRKHEHSIALSTAVLEEYTVHINGN